VARVVCINTMIIVGDVNQAQSLDEVDAAQIFRGFSMKGRQKSKRTYITPMNICSCFLLTLTNSYRDGSDYTNTLFSSKFYIQHGSPQACNLSLVLIDATQPSAITSITTIVLVMSTC